MYKDQILNRYGQYLDSSDIEELQTIQPAFFNNDYYYIRGESGALVSNAGAGMNFNLPYLDGRNYSYNLVPVYEVEWLTTNKETVDGKTIYRMDRYSGVRVGENIYIDMGKDEPIRSVENPYECFNTINGMFYSDRNGNPYSLVLATANLQDTYDILHFHRDSLIANSGVRGDFLDISQLPTFLGSSVAERIMKWKAYKKQGLAPVNTAQEGRGANHNTIYAGYDDTVSGQAIQAIQLVIQATEDTCSAITGVFRERLGAIEQRDAVTNVDVGIKQSAIITKQYYQVMDNITTELLIDALNACKESYKDGMIGSIILGNDKQKVFSVEPIYFSFTDYDIHIADSGDVIRDMQKIDQLTVELIKSGQADIDIIFATIGTESMTELKQQVLSAFGKKKEENNVVQQLQQQLQQMQQQLQQTQKQAQQLASENESLKSKNTNLEAKAIEYDYDVRKEANRNTRTYNDERIEVDKQNLAVEEAQLYDGDPHNDKVNKSKI
jgi:regulator of replication initiation timing